MAAHQVQNNPTWADTYVEWEHTHIVVDRTNFFRQWMVTTLQAEVVARLVEMQTLSATQGWDQATVDGFVDTLFAVNDIVQAQVSRIQNPTLFSLQGLWTDFTGV